VFETKSSENAYTIFAMSVPSHVTTLDQLNSFQLNLILGSSINVCQNVSVLTVVGQ
jgi:hypothetical protein